MPIDAGLLNWRVTLEQPNGEDGSFAPVATVWANFRGASGSEALRFGQQQSTALTIVTIRFRSDLKASWRVTNSDVAPAHTLQILSFQDPDGSREQLQLVCTEVI